MTSVIVAMIMALSPDGSFMILGQPKEMPLEQCITEAEALNSDPSIPYFMVCAPKGAMQFEMIGSTPGTNA